MDEIVPAIFPPNLNLACFASAIQSGHAGRPVPGSLEGLVNMKIVDAAYQSARTGKVVDL